MGKRKGFRGIVVFLSASLFFAGTAYASEYNDVPNTHWAYKQIEEMSDKGILVGDSSGNFNPEETVDKFYAVKVLAKAAGFKYVSLTQEEKTYMELANSRAKELLEQFKSSYKEWDATADREISFLLERNILVNTDLNQFVIRAADGTESLPHLTREEYCVFLVRLMGKTTEALGNIVTNTYEDDASIASGCKPYVYYLRDKGIVASSGSFEPKKAMTKAAMAVMTANALEQADTVGSAFVVPPAVVPLEPQKKGAVVTIVHVVGTISAIYEENNAVRITMENGTTATYKFAPNGTILVDGEKKSLSELMEGTQVACIVSNNQIAELKAVSNGVRLVSETSVEGIVSSVEELEGRVEIKIRVPQATVKGTVSYVETLYVAAKHCSVVRDGQEVPFSSVQENETIYAQVSGRTVLSIKLEGENTSLSNGVLTSKYFDATSLEPIFVITDEQGVTHSFAAEDNTLFFRQGDPVYWNKIYVGDTVNVQAVGRTLVRVEASGVFREIIGYVDDIHIKNGVSTITIRETKEPGGSVATYPVTGEGVNLYGLTLNSKVRLRMESSEIQELVVQEKATDKMETMTGYITKLSEDSISITDGDAERLLYVNKDTEFASASDEEWEFEKLAEKQEVYVTLRVQDGKRYAKKITALK